MNKFKNKKPDVESIDQILEKIKIAINEDTKSLRSQHTEEITSSTIGIDPEVLELTNVVSHSAINNKSTDINDFEEKNFDLISQHIKKFTRKLNLLMKDNYIISEKEVRQIFKETLQPYLKSWLNNNLKDIVKEVLEAEVKKIFKKLYNS